MIISVGLMSQCDFVFGGRQAVQEVGPKGSYSFPRWLVRGWRNSNTSSSPMYVIGSVLPGVDCFRRILHGLFWLGYSVRLKSVHTFWMSDGSKGLE